MQAIFAKRPFPEAGETALRKLIVHAAGVLPPPTGRANIEPVQLVGYAAQRPFLLPPPLDKRRYLGASLPAWCAFRPAPRASSMCGFPNLVPRRFAPARAGQ
jgi:hypothetical protein